MECCDCRLKMDKQGSDTPLFGVTPAEVQVLSHVGKDPKGKDSIGHTHFAGGFPIQNVVEGSVREAKEWKWNSEDSHWFEDKKKGKPRDTSNELARLKGKYGAKKIELLWPGINPTLPQTFKELPPLPWVKDDARVLGLDKTEEAKKS